MWGVSEPSQKTLNFDNVRGSWIARAVILPSRRDFYHKVALGYPFNRSWTSLGQWNVLWPAPTTPSRLGSFGLGSGLMQTAWTTWNGCGGLAASFVRPVVIWEDGGLGTEGSCVLDAVAAHR
jgi:hypothetical protein